MSEVAVTSVARIHANGGYWEYHPHMDITPLEAARCMAYVIVPGITGDRSAVENIPALKLHRHFRWVPAPQVAQASPKEPDKDESDG